MSFSELMSGDRGRGVIRLLMALVVLGGLGYLFMYAMDDGSEAQSIETEIAQQGRDIEGYKASLAQGAVALEKAEARLADVKELARLKRANQFLQENIANLKKGIAAGEADIASRNGEFEAYKDEYRAFAWAKAKDETLESLTTLAGEVYKNVNIREVTAVGIEIRHAEGHKRIPYEELPVALKDRFQFDPKLKEKAVAEEAAKEEKK